MSQKRWIDGYEHNLSLILDALKDELSILNKDKSHQESSFKTILWFNVILLGFLVKSQELNSIAFANLLLISVAIVLALFGSLEGRKKVYPSMCRPRVFETLPNDEWIKTQGLLTAIYSYRRAVKYNGINLIKRAKWLRMAKVATVISFLGSIFLFVALNYQGATMSKESPKPATPTKPVIKPSTAQRTNSSVDKRTFITKSPAKPKGK